MSVFEKSFNKNYFLLRTTDPHPKSLGCYKNVSVFIYRGEVVSVDTTKVNLSFFYKNMFQTPHLMQKSDVIFFKSVSQYYVVSNIGYRERTKTF